MVMIAPTIAGLGLLIVYLLGSYMNDAEIDLNFVHEGRLIVSALVAVLAGIFGFLQARYHPFRSRVMSQWLLAAGWKGDRDIHGFNTTIPWSEWMVVAGFVLTEAIVAGGLWFPCVVCWLIGRICPFTSQLNEFGELRATQVLRSFMLFFLLFLNWPSLIVGATILTAFYCDHALQRALKTWSRQAAMADNRLLPKLAEAPKFTDRLFPWHQLSVTVKDCRPKISERLTIVLLVSAWALLASWRLDERLFAVFSRNNTDAIRLLHISVAMVVGLPLFVVAAWRLSWYSMINWGPAVSLWARIVRLRPIIWQYDKPFLALIPIPFLTLLLWSGVNATPLPVQFQAMIVSSGCATMLLFFSIDPIKWQLTCPAKLRRPNEQYAVQQDRRRQAAQISFNSSG